MISTALLLLSLNTPGAVLQTHVCDTLGTPKSSRQGTFTTQVCWTQKDVDGAPVTATLLEALVDGVVKASVVNPQPIGAANRDGKSVFEVPGVNISGRGVHLVTHRISTLDGQATSDGIQHTITNGSPMKPDGDRVK